MANDTERQVDLTTESQWEATVKMLAKLGGWLYYHTYRSKRSPAGFPDCFMVKPPRIILAELKSEDGKLSLEQKEWLRVLSQCKALEVYTWRPSEYEEVKKVLVGKEVE